MPNPSSLFICWTTVPSKEQAEQLAADAIETGLAACAQVEAPVTSMYRWRGNVEKEQELRITFFAVESTLSKLESLIHEKHPYDTPKWVCLKAEKVSEKYLKWANEASNLRGFS